MTTMDKNKELQRQQEDAAFAHGLWWVGGAIVIEVLLLLINQFYFNFTTDPASVARAEITVQVMRGLMVIAPVLYVLAAIKGFLQFKKTGTICYVVEGVLGMSAFLSLAMAMVLSYKADGCSMMLLFIPAAGILAFMFFLYQRDFFYSAAYSGMGALVLWMIWHQSVGRVVLVYIAVAKIVIFAGLLGWVVTLLKKSGGTLTLLGHTVRFLPKDALYPIVYASLALSAGLSLVGFLVGGYVAYYLIYALAAWIFALLVYYTVRML